MKRKQFAVASVQTAGVKIFIRRRRKPREFRFLRIRRVVAVHFTDGKTQADKAFERFAPFKKRGDGRITRREFIQILLNRRDSGFIGGGIIRRRNRSGFAPPDKGENDPRGGD